ncbi:hypothetical protein BDV06DRAFT_226952 [Aspergillus oleicola]
MELKVPENHFLFGTGEESYSSPITGSLYLLASSVTSTPEITIELVRYVRPKNRKSPLLRRGWHLADSLSKRRSQSIPHSIRILFGTTSIPKAQSETLVQCQLWTSPNAADSRNQRRKYDFSLPVPFDIPATMQMVLGTVSYAVTATASSPTATLRESRAVRMVRLVRPETISHTRRYPGDKVVTELSVTPAATELSPKGRGATYHLEWLARSIIMKGLRGSEVRYIVAKELKWRVEEIISLIVITHGNQRRNICQQHVRQVCRGRTKGRWIESGRLNGHDAIRILFEVQLPATVDSTDVSFYPDYARRDSLAITAEHRLYVEVITGEDTFHRATGDLVDRKARVKSYKAAFTLPVDRFAPDYAICTQPGNELPICGNISGSARL